MVESGLTLCFHRGQAVRGVKRTIWYRGCAFHGTTPVDWAKLLFSLPLSREALKGELSCLNGFFAVALQEENHLLAAVDRVRSYPLFFSQLRNQAFLLGDAPYQIQERLGGREFDMLAAVELLLTCYTIGDSTMDSRVKQLPAGEILEVEARSGEWSVHREEYYRFHHHDALPGEPEDLERAHREVMERAIDRLLRYADGSTIAVPLSGGYDSRFIILTLKKLGCSRLLAYSYGIPGNAEARTSQRIAGTLGIPWHFIPYSPEKWKECFASSEYIDFMLSAEAMNSVAHIQDWPAVRELRLRGVLDEGTIFVPGHSGDFLGGKQIPSSLLREGKLSEGTVTEAVWRRHYVNFSLDDACRIVGLPEKEQGILIDRTIKHFEGFDVTTLEGANDAYDFEFWKEKLSKYIVNSVRVYENQGYRWWLPFYDADFVAFWERMPLRYRMGKHLYNRTIEGMQCQYGISSKEEAKLKMVRHGLYRLPWFRKLHWALRGKRGILRSSPLGLVLMKVFPRELVATHLRQGGGINTFTALRHWERYKGEATHEA